MGIGEATGFVLLTLLGGVVLTHALERRIGSPERGPARPVSLSCTTGLPNSDRWVFAAGPIAALMGVLLGTVILPFGPTLVARDLGIGVFYFIVVIDFVVLGIALTGWGANPPDAVESCYRIVAQLANALELQPGLA
jgi:NADH-quinone oxidoreductase subunit H